MLADSLTGLRAEIGDMRDDLEAIRDQLGQPAVVAGDTGSSGDAVEGRLAAIEDTLDGLAERFESLARDSAVDAGERLASLDDRIAAIAQSLQAERAAAAAHRERSGLALQDQGAALDEWAEAVSSGLERSRRGGGEQPRVVGFGGHDGASTSGREAERRHLEALVAELSQTIEESFGAIHSQVEAYHAPLDGRLDELQVSVLDGFGAARARLVEELSDTITRLEDANTATRAMLDSEVAGLRSDLADALDEGPGPDRTTVIERTNGRDAGGANERRPLHEHRGSAEARITVDPQRARGRDGGARTVDRLTAATLTPASARRPWTESRRRSPGPTSR